MAPSSASLPIRFWTLGWSSLIRDWRAGELRLLVLAVTLAVAALTAVGFFADRLQGGLARDARALIGGDAVLSSDNAPPPEFEARARELGLSTARTLGFPTMGRASDEDGGAARLVALKAVSDSYPLRGTLRVATGPDAPDEAVKSIPPAGSVWVDAALLVALDLKMGQTLLLGDARFTIDRVLVVEPDRGAGFMSFAPRVMLNEADLPATGLVQPASRLTYRVAVAGPDNAVSTFSRWAQERIDSSGVRGTRLESLEGGRPEMERTLERAEKFLNLVALLAALLCAVAVAIAARGFAQRHLDDCAMLRVLGLSQGTMARAYTLEFALVGLFASSLGVLLGFLVHHVFVLLLAGLVEASLPAPGITPVLLGGFKTMLALFLLEMGLCTARVCNPLPWKHWRLMLFALGMPVILASIGLVISGVIGMPAGSALVFATLMASASYIAAPAAIRMAVPEANPSLSIGASLGITFPFNITVGIPLYYAASQWLLGASL